MQIWTKSFDLLEWSITDSLYYQNLSLLLGYLTKQRGKKALKLRIWSVKLALNIIFLPSNFRVLFWIIFLKGLYIDMTWKTFSSLQSTHLIEQQWNFIIVYFHASSSLMCWKLNWLTSWNVPDIIFKGSCY